MTIKNLNTRTKIAALTFAGVYVLTSLTGCYNNATKHSNGYYIYANEEQQDRENELKKDNLHKENIRNAEELTQLTDFTSVVNYFKTLYNTDISEFTDFINSIVEFNVQEISSTIYTDDEVVLVYESSNEVISILFGTKVQFVIQSKKGNEEFYFIEVKKDSSNEYIIFKYQPTKEDSLLEFVYDGSSSDNIVQNKSIISKIKKGKFLEIYKEFDFKKENDDTKNLKCRYLK